MASITSAAAVEFVAVINSFNRCELLREALDSLTAAIRHCPQFPGAIIVYEVGSTDGSREFLEAWQRDHPGDLLEIVIPAPDAGTSFSDGVNAGCAEALRRFPSAQWLLLYETDNWIASPEPLLQAREVLITNSQLAAAGWTVRKHTGEYVGYGMCFPYPLALAAGQNLCLLLNLESANKTPWQRAPGGVEWRHCDVVFTSPLLIRRSVWEKAGGFDAAAFPFTDSDLDWAWRVQRAGLGDQSVVRSDAVVHDNRAQASAWSSDRVIKFQRSRMALLRRHRGALRVNTIKPLLFLRRALEGLLLALAAKTGRPNASEKLAARLELMRTVWRD